MAGSSEKANNKNWIKLAIVPVLLGVLGIVLWSNQGPAAVVPPPQAATNSAPEPKASAVASAKDVMKPKRVAWPKFTQEQILGTNPFRASRAMLMALKPHEATSADATTLNQGNTSAPAEIAESIDEEDPWAALLREFPAAGKGIYLESSKGAAFKVGSRLFQVGDVIGARYRIREIRPEGLIVETAPAPK